ncbi:MAG: Ig-like domain-containing protein, partial [Acidimicrobiia bacterium]|nr:Ig-like domain-containing protein [Acidimicrobiia bacterium]
MLLAAVLAGCDALLTEPAPPPATVDISFQISAAPLGGPATAFAKVRRVRVVFARPDSTTRDTVFSVVPVDGRIRVPVALEVEERVEALGIGATLGVLTTSLFQGTTVVRIEPGEPTSAVIDVQAIPAAVGAEAPVILIPNVGESVQLSSAVLFASGDTITGLQGSWLSEDPSIVSVTPDGLATAQQLGQTRLEVRYETFADTAVVATSPVDSIAVLPSDTTLAISETAQLNAVLLDALGNALTGRPVVWGTLDPLVATVGPTGLVTAVGPGATSVVATSGSATASVPITVTGAPPVQWLATAGGNWGDPANWSTGVVPGPGDDVEITADGTYTVTMDVDVSVASLLFGGATGTQTLTGSNRTVSTATSFDIGGGGVLDLTDSSINGGGLGIASGASATFSGVTVNAPVALDGTLVVERPSTLSGALTTGVGSTL